MGDEGKGGVQDDSQFLPWTPLWEEAFFTEKLYKDEEANLRVGGLNERHTAYKVLGGH